MSVYRSASELGMADSARFLQAGFDHFHVVTRMRIGRVMTVARGVRGLILGSSVYEN